jgi:DNA-binding beta-propeller fold protein YncE
MAANPRTNTIYVANGDGNTGSVIRADRARELRLLEQALLRGS